MLGDPFEETTQAAAREEICKLSADVCRLSDAIERTDPVVPVMPPESVNLFFQITASLEKFQDKPHLLEPHSEEISVSLIKTFQFLLPCASGRQVCDLTESSSKFDAFLVNYQQSHKTVYTLGEAPQSPLMTVARLLYTLCKVVTPKTILHAFPSAGKLIVPVLEDCISSLMDDKSTENEWEVAFVQLLWLSVLVKVPFPLTRYHPNLQRVLIQLCKMSLLTSHSSKQASDFAVALFLRPDTLAELGSFVQWSSNACGDLNRPMNIVGILQCMARLLKSIPEAYTKNDSAFQKIINGIDPKTLRSREAIKFLTQTAVMWLKSQKAECSHDPTQYDQSCKENVVHSPITHSASSAARIRTTINMLIDLLSDKNSDIRRQAAKSIGILTALLPPLEEIVVLSKVHRRFANETDDKSWHGGILALAELTRRQICLEYSGFILNIISAAIRFEVRKETASGVGTHVRDATCYLIWTIARVGSMRLINQTISTVGPDLLFQLCFDREVMVRRAASAAYQELVGRHNATAVEILTVNATNFFAIANRNHSLKVSYEVAQLNPILRRTFIQRLSRIQLSHWDKEVRMLAAQAIGNLAGLEGTVSLENIRTILQQCGSCYFETRHGSLQALSEILSCPSDVVAKLLAAEEGVQVEKEVVELLPKLKSFLSLRAKGAETYITTVCAFMKSVGKVSKVRPGVCTALLEQYLNRDVRSYYVSVMLDFLGSSCNAVSSAAAEALGSFLSHLYSGDENRAFRIEFNQKRLSQAEKAKIPAHRRGFIRLFGNLPECFLAPSLRPITDFLTVCVSNEQCVDDVEARKLAIDALASVISKCMHCLGTQQLNGMARSILAGFHDYTVDFRGDIGSIVRHAAADGILAVLLKVALIERDDRELQTFYITFFHDAFGELVKQLLSKLDSIRNTAHVILAKMIKSAAKIDEKWQIDIQKQIGIPKSLWDYFLFEDDCASKQNELMRYSIASFGPFLRLLNENHFRSAVEGVITSVSSLSIHVVDDAEKMLRELVEDLTSFERLGGALMKILQSNRQNYRMVSAAMSTLTFLHREKGKLPVADADVLVEVSYALKRYGGSIHKALPLVPVFAILLSTNDETVRKHTFMKVSEFLRWSSYPKMRSRVADILLMHFTQVETRTKSASQAMEIESLLVLPWNEDDLEYQPILQDALRRLCVIWNIALPQEEIVDRAHRRAGTGYSYASLVRESHI